MKDIFIDFNVKFGLEKVWKWKWWILAVTILTGALAVYFSLRIPNEFKSTASFIPPGINSLTSMIHNDGSSYKGFYSGVEEDIDRTVAYLSSRDVTDSLARRYNLYEHYGIGSEDPNRDKFFYHIFSTKNSISYSGNSVVAIECYDEDPNMAYQLAGAYLNIAREWFETLSRRREGLATAEERLSEAQNQRVGILDSLAFLRNEYKIYLVRESPDEIGKLVVPQIRNSKEFNTNYDKLFSLELQLLALEERIADLQGAVVSRRNHLEEFPELIWVTETPAPSTFKARPKRSIIVILAVLAAFIFASFVAIMLDRAKDNFPMI